MPKAGMRSTTRSDVAANGIVSVTHNVTANARMARHALPFAVNAIRLPARSSGGGDGRRLMPNSRTIAPAKIASLRSRRGARSSTLETEARAELNRARRLGARDHAEVRGTQREAGQVEVRVIQQVVRLDADVDLPARGKADALLDRQV